MPLPSRPQCSQSCSSRRSTRDSVFSRDSLPRPPLQILDRSTLLNSKFAPSLRQMRGTIAPARGTIMATGTGHLLASHGGELRSPAGHQLARGLGRAPEHLANLGVGIAHVVERYGGGVLGLQLFELSLQRSQ